MSFENQNKFPRRSRAFYVPEGRVRIGPEPYYTWTRQEFNEAMATFEAELSAALYENDHQRSERARYDLTTLRQVYSDRFGEKIRKVRRERRRRLRRNQKSRKDEEGHIAL